MSSIPSNQMFYTFSWKGVAKAPTWCRAIPFLGWRWMVRFQNVEASRVFQSHKKFYHRCWDVSFNNWNHQIGLPFTIPILSVLGREPHPTGLDTLCRWNGPNHSGLKYLYAEACQNCSWSQTMETLWVVYTLLKKGFGFWWDEMYFLHAKTKTDNLFLKTKFSQGFIHTTTTSLGIFA
jgi:hypothetical protein